MSWLWSALIRSIFRAVFAARAIYIPLQDTSFHASTILHPKVGTILKHSNPFSLHKYMLNKNICSIKVNTTSNLFTLKMSKNTTPFSANTIYLQMFINLSHVTMSMSLTKVKWIAKAGWVHSLKGGKISVKICKVFLGRWKMSFNASLKSAQFWS